jgi:amino acid transporter
MNKQNKLATNTLSAIESIFMGIAGTAPGFSIAATTALLISSAGILSPATMLYSGLMMFGITLAFMYLNKTEANSGASYAWVSRIFGINIGFFAGWAMLVFAAIATISGSITASTATLQLLTPQHASEPIWVTSVAAIWLVAISTIIARGIKAASYTQILMTFIEIGILLIIIIAALLQFSTHPAHTITWSQFSPTAFTPKIFINGALVALFFFCGWDVTSNLNEETRDGSHTAGRAAIYSMIIAVLLFTTFITITLVALTDKEINQASTNIVFVLADKLFPRPWSYMAAIAVILSAIGTLETVILQFSRTLFAQSRHGSLHPRYATLHPQWNTPFIATLTIMTIGLAFLFLSTNLPNIQSIIKDAIDAIGILVAFYYCLAGFACAWHYRKEAFKHPGHIIAQIIWPLISSIFLVFAALYSIPTLDPVAKVLCLGGIAIGFVPLTLNRLRQKQLNQRSSENELIENII